ncbi:30S ribosomal protein S16 [Patescibacteria group bacterium]|nr:30S ribosomal protein S16 [Patescibacteria group bacterium]
MLKIKLIRFGKRNQPHYRVVVQEARTKRDGKYTAKLGHYAPTQDPKILEINLEEYNKWIAKGAQPTDTVASLAKRFKSGNPFPPKKKKPSKKQLAKAKQAQEKPAKEPDKAKQAQEKPAKEPVKKPAKEPDKAKKPVKKPAKDKKETKAK